ncbi:MAG: aminoglycoside phosphotransferase family protein [Dehalococcoidia bacterium]|jgi:aminoglycoside phosphotransferase (APT) family kinase protein|nr:aminoglycoside phosphotransferase family protein [Dehalococcoidia bacterium]
MPGLGTLADAPAIARIVHAATGVDPDDMRIAGRGQTSIGWRVDAPGGPYCVIVAIPPEARHQRYHDEPTNYAARHAVLTALANLHAGTARPIATAATIEGSDPADGRWDWIVTTWTQGAPTTGAITDTVATELGRFLATLHSIPTQGFGWLQDTATTIRGAESTRHDGMLSRWYPDLWPFDGRPLIEHPLIRVAPQLVTTVSQLRELLLRFENERTEVALCHTDLNPEHILVDGDHLGGVIDFGDAAVVPPAFDIASFAYYFGWQSTEALLEGYTSNSVLRDIRRAEAQQLSIALALQKIEKHTVAIPDEARLATAMAFLNETLPVAARRQA